MATSEEVQDYLMSLGTSGEEVAQSLRGLGVVARGCGPANCPLRTALAQKFPLVTDFGVGFIVVLWDTNIGSSFLPRACVQFVSELARGMHCDLVVRERDS